MRPLNESLNRANMYTESREIDEVYSFHFKYMNI